MAAIILCVTNILKTMSIKPHDQARGSHYPSGADIGDRKHLCVVSGQGPGRVAEAGEDICRVKIIVSLGGSQSPPATHFILPGARGWANENKTPQCSLPAATPRGADVGSWAHPDILSSLSEHRGVEEEYVVVISQLTRSALCFIRWELHRPRLISGLLLPLILHILGVTWRKTS